MPRIKLKNKDRIIKISIKIKSEENANCCEVNIIEKKRIKGIIRLCRHSSRQLTGELFGSVMLREYLQNGICADEYISVIKQIINVIEIANKYSLKAENIVFNLNYIFYNLSTNEVSLIYLPIDNMKERFNIAALCKDMASCVNLKNADCYEIVNKVTDIFERSEIIGNFNQLKNHLDLLLADKDKKSDNIDEMPETIACSEDTQNNPKIEYNIPDTVPFSNEDNEFSETIAFDDEDSSITPETVPLAYNSVAENISKKPHAEIKRISTGEITEVNKEIFIIGKQFDRTDYCITDNKTISRVHATIKYIGETFYLIDMGSSNHSYVDGTLAEEGKCYPLFKGTRFYLSNEEFIFNT